MNEVWRSYLHKVAYFTLLAEILCILPWFVGIYEEIYTSNQEGIYYLGGGVLLGLVFGVISILQKRWKITEARRKIAWIFWGIALGVSYSNIFQLNLLGNMLASITGFCQIIVLLWYPARDSSQEITEKEYQRVIFGTMASVGGFLFLNGWLVLVNWALRFVGLFIVACLNLSSLHTFQDGGKKSIETRVKTPPRKHSFAIGTTSTLKLLILFLISAIVTLAIFSGVRDDVIKETQPQFLASVFIFAAVGVASMSFLAGFGTKRHARKSVLLTSLVLLILCETAFYMTGSIDMIWVSLQLLIAGLTLGIILAEILLFQEPSQKISGLAIFLMILLFLGVILLSDVAYPSEWIPYQMPSLILAVIAGGISIYQLVVEVRAKHSKTEETATQGRLV